MVVSFCNLPALCLQRSDHHRPCNNYHEFDEALMISELANSLGWDKFGIRLDAIICCVLIYFTLEV